MSIDRELLWKAWPDGYLAMRGVKTVGGWVCQQTEPHLLFTKDDMTGRYPQVDWAVIKQGRSYCSLVETPFDQDLLPNIDTADAATWACLMQDVATALGLPPGLGYRWFGGPGTGWELQVFTRHHVHRDEKASFIDIHADDPALALVLARIQLREKGA